MRQYILKRLLQLIPVLLGVSIVVFLLIRLVPGDVVQMYVGTQVSPTAEQMEELKRLFGIDKPLYVQYLDWIWRVMHGDFGVSLRTARPVLNDILARLPVSAELAFLSLTFALLLGVPAGILSALRRNSVTDAISRIIGIIGLSIPDFWLATLIILFASRYLTVLRLASFVSITASLSENLKAMVLPTIAFGLGLAAVLMRYVRSSVLEVLGQDYIRTARAKGLAGRTVIFKHALRNALTPVITVVGIYAGYLLGGTVVIEEVFALPGMGRLALYAIYQRDYPLVQGIVLLVTLAFVLINLLVDILYVLVDPRIRYD
ncbi:MAG: ABC transporter permease [Firmicutes bacterium]|nr:ABC transporter permease [Bacillota bacterium]